MRRARNTLRLSFVTVAPALIEQGVAALGRVLRQRAGGPAMKRRFDQLDVFTAEALRGNPLAVVHDAQGLDDARMAAFARWTNLSETTFLLPPTDAARRLPRAHLHARRRAALRRPPDAGQLPRLAGGRRPAAAATAWWCSNAASAWCACGATARGWPSPAPPLRRSGPLDAAAAGARSAQALRPGRGARCVASAGLDNGPGWCAVLLDRADEVLRAAARPAAAEGLAKVGVVGAQRRGARQRSFEVRAFVAAVGSRRRPGHRQPERQPGAVADRRAAWRRRATWRRRARRWAAPGACSCESQDGATVWVGGEVRRASQGEVML